MKESFKQQLAYDLEANKKMLATIMNNRESTPEDCIRLMSHNIAAHETWNSRIEGRNAKVGVWEGTPLDEMEASIYQNYENSLFILDKFTLQQIIEYSNTKGDPYSNTVNEILTHVLMHSMYHRGQIARSLREVNIAPPDTNYISFVR